MKRYVRKDTGRNRRSVLCRTGYAVVTLLLWASPLLTIGCSSGSNLYAVQGEVSFDGNPIETGNILFRKVEGDQRGFNAEIKNGRYKMMVEAGAMTVEIIGSRLIPGKFDYPGGPDSPGFPVGEMYIPAQYNTKTTLTAEVAASRSNDISFELKSNRSPSR